MEMLFMKYLNRGLTIYLSIDIESIKLSLKGNGYEKMNDLSFKLFLFGEFFYTNR